jgi:hypothetical protein
VRTLRLERGGQFCLACAQTGKIGCLLFGTEGLVAAREIDLLAVEVIEPRAIDLGGAT